MCPVGAEASSPNLVSRAPASVPVRCAQCNGPCPNHGRELSTLYRVCSMLAAGTHSCRESVGPYSVTLYVQDIGSGPLPCAYANRHGSRTMRPPRTYTRWKSSPRRIRFRAISAMHGAVSAGRTSAGVRVAAAKARLYSATAASRAAIALASPTHGLPDGLRLQDAYQRVRVGRTLAFLRLTFAKRPHGQVSRNNVARVKERHVLVSSTTNTAPSTITLSAPAASNAAASACRSAISNPAYKRERVAAERQRIAVVEQCRARRRDALAARQDVALEAVL